MFKYFFFFFLLISAGQAKAQKVEFYPAKLFPAKPYGGMEELERLVKQVMVYPEEALKKEVEGKVFIRFKIDPKGKPQQLTVSSELDSSLEKEALRLFKQIEWLTAEEQSANIGELDEIQLEFDLKKYKRLVKKRGYEKLPYPNQVIDESLLSYSINELDKAPEIANATSINAFLAEHFNYPSIALQRGISGRVSMEFVVEPFGQATNIHILKSLPGGCDEEAKRLVRKMRWVSGVKDGKAVRCLYRYDLNFVNPGGEIR